MTLQHHLHFCRKVGSRFRMFADAHLLPVDGRRGVWGRGEVVTVGEARLRRFGRVQRRGQPVYRWEDEERGLSPPRKSTEEIYEVR